MGTYSLPLYHAILLACVIVGGLIVFGVVSRLRSHRKYFGELRRQSQEMISMQEQELRRLTLDLHDGILPLLSLVRLQLRKCYREEDNPRLRKTEEMVLQAIEELRRVMRNLVPRHLEEKGLAVVLEELFLQCRELYGVEVEFGYAVRTLLPESKTIHLYRLVQEAVHNALRHSGAGLLEVMFREEGGMLYIVCRDNGKGFLPGEQEGYGLQHLRLRTVLLGGRFQCESVPGQGTSYFFRVPVGKGG